MAHFETTIHTRASAKAAFEYLIDFSNAQSWDPSVSSATRRDSGPIDVGSRFHLSMETLRGAKPIRFEYEITRLEPNRLVCFLSEGSNFRSLDTITIEPKGAPDGPGCRVQYDADLRPRGLLYLMDAPLHIAFQWSGRRSAAGLARALDRLGETSA